jgi:malate dehydrogenase
MGGALDSARFKYYLSQELNCSPADLNAVVIGGHGDTTMIPLIQHATWNSIPVTQLLSKEQQEKVVSSTMVGGATLTKLIGTSAWYAPGAGTAAMVESIIRDEKKLISCGVALDGEYGQSDISLVVPVILGKNGWEKILDFKLSDEEQATFNKSADAVRSMNNVLAEASLV